MPDATAWRCAYCLRQQPYATRIGNAQVCVRCRDSLAAKGKKFCPDCKKVLPLDRFQPIGSRPGQRRGRCRRCRQPLATASLARWRQRHPERMRAIRKAYNDRNREKVRRWSHETYRRRATRGWRGQLTLKKELP